MSGITKLVVLLGLATAPPWMVERAKQCAQTRTAEEVFRFAPSDMNPTFRDPTRCFFERSSGTDGGVFIVESVHVTSPVQSKKGWVLGECVTARRTQTRTSVIEVTLSCEHPNQKLREVETRTDGVVVTRVFNHQTGVLERAFTDRRLFDGKFITRCEQFSSDGGVTEVIEYGTRVGDACVPVGGQLVPARLNQFEYQRQ